jgi:SET domain-containing protein
MNPKLEVRDTKKYGKGVFAKKDIGSNEILCIFGGYIKSTSEEEGLPEKIKDEGVQISSEFALGIIKEDEQEDASFFNHSCNPNAGFKGQIFLVPMRKIKRDEQVTFDYAMVLSKAKDTKFYKIKCYCNARNCRKFITDNDWKIPILRKKYNGFFQWYLQDKISNSKK